MMFAGKPKNTEPAQPKRRSTFGMLFNPHIGDSIRPIGQSFNTFVHLIRAGVRHERPVPRNHPALMGTPGAQLRLQDIISTAWNGLSFTRKGLPKVLLFFAVAAA